MLQIARPLRPAKEIDCVNNETLKSTTRETHYLKLLGVSRLFHSQVPVVGVNEANANYHSEKDIDKDKIGPERADQVKEA